MKNIKKYSFLALAIIGFAAGGIYFGYLVENKHQPAKDQQNLAATEVEAEPEATIPAETSPEKATEIVETPAPAQSKIVPPMDNFNGRITLNAFGNQPSKMQVPEGKYTDLVCKEGKYYPGYHTAVDLEVTTDERNKSVPVYSIADGVVRQAGSVNGYGGLMVIEHVINGKTYTAYYGHMNVNSFTVKTGSKVKAGQKLAELAPSCSAANGNTRKHLHFGIHKGKAVVVAGYVNAKSELNNWIDPREIIK